MTNIFKHTLYVVGAALFAMSCTGAVASSARISGLGGPRPAAEGGISSTGEDYTGTISGKVTTADGKAAAAGVPVLLAGPADRSAYTNGQGLFSFHHLRSGTYKVRITFIGYQTAEKAVVLGEGQSVTLRMQLKVSSSQLKEVVVTSHVSPNTRIPTLAGMQIRVKDLPQAVSIIDRKVMDRQQVQSLGDVLENVPGIYVMGQTGGVQQEIGGRGYVFGSTNTFKNGVRFNNGLMPEMTGVQRVEFLKGSTAILLGNVAPGGVLNLITKKPSFTPGGQITMRAGSYGYYKPSVDIYGPVSGSKTVAFRVNTAFETTASFREDVHARRYYINPSFLIRASDRTTVVVEGDYLAEKRTLDYGVGTIDFKINDIPRDRFLGVPWSYHEGQEGSVTVTTTHRFTPGWRLRNITGYYHYDDDLFGTTRPGDQGGFAMQPDGNWVRGIQRGIDHEDYVMTRLEVNGKLHTGKVAHQLLFGVTAHKEIPHTTTYNPLLVYDSINVFHPGRYPPRGDIPVLSKNTLTRAPLSLLGAYLQDLVSVTKQLKVLAGVRLNVAENSSHTLDYATQKTSVARYDAHPVTPDLGIVYEPEENISVYGSYTNAFTLNKGVDTSGKALPPSYINEYEIGIKTDWFDRLLTLNVSAYRIVNSNLAETSLANGNTNRNIKELEGQVTGDGVEVEITSRPLDGFNLRAGYSYNHTRYTRSNIYKVGSPLQYVPATTAKASLYYAFRANALKGLELGMTGLYVAGMDAGKQTRLTVPDDNRRLIPLPQFMRIDLTAAYHYKKLTWGVKLSNALGAMGYYAHEDESVNPIAPRELSAYLSCRL
jgi:iron complex outermembrane receptor protein